MTRAAPASHLSDADRERLRRALVQKHELLLRAAEAARTGGRAAADGEIELGDVAERVIEQDEALRTLAIDTATLAEVEHALAKLEAGTYGLSEQSGTPIELARLLALPWARRTADEEARHRSGR